MDKPQPSTSFARESHENMSYSYEEDSSKRHRTRNRLIRKLHRIIDEYVIRVGEQAAFLIVKSSQLSQVYGSQPLMDIIQNLDSDIKEQLKDYKEKEKPLEIADDYDKFVLPPLVVDGEFKPLEKFNQAELRSFIPLLIKYSTCRGKPGWGRLDKKPEWWPHDLPWKNIRIDYRSESEKQKHTFTYALKLAVLSCYKYHNREDLLTEEYYKEHPCKDLNSYYYIGPQKKKITVSESISEDMTINFVEVPNPTSVDATFDFVEETKPTSVDSLPGNICTNTDGTPNTIAVLENTSFITNPFQFVLNRQDTNIIEYVPLMQYNQVQRSEQNQAQLCNNVENKQAIYNILPNDAVLYVPETNQDVLDEKQEVVYKPINVIQYIQEHILKQDCNEKKTNQNDNHLYLQNHQLLFVPKGTVKVVYNDTQEEVKLMTLDKIATQYFQATNVNSNSEEIQSGQHFDLQKDSFTILNVGGSITTCDEKNKEDDVSKPNILFLNDNSIEQITETTESGFTTSAVG